MGKRHKNKPEIGQIKCTVGDLVRSQGLLNMLNQARMPARTGLQVRRIIKTIAPELEIYNKTREELLDRYAEKDKDGEKIVKHDRYQITDQEAFDAEYEELMAAPVSLNLRALSLDDLAEIEVPRPVPEGLPIDYVPWKPSPLELDVIYYLLSVDEEPENGV